MKRQKSAFYALLFLSIVSIALLGALGMYEYDSAKMPVLTATVSGERVSGAADDYRQELTLGGVRGEQCDVPAPISRLSCGARVQLYCDGMPVDTCEAEATAQDGNVQTLHISNGEAILPDEEGVYTIRLCTRQGRKSANLILHARVCRQSAVGTLSS